MSNYKPIESYAIIGNTETAALVNLDGSIDWCCLPRFDSPSVFAALLDSGKGGCFSVAPSDKFESSQGYEEGTNILKTVFKTKAGTTELTDFMPCFERNGKTVALPEIHRRIACTDGVSIFQIRFSPKFHYGSIEPAVLASEDSIKASVTDESLLLKVTGPNSEQQYADIMRLESGGTLWLSLRYERTADSIASEWKVEADAKLDLTKQFWRSWIRNCNYNGRWSDFVRRSALTLKLLSYAPTGALVAAATTSLPEEIGGSRNWDYRYIWIRDSSYALWALKRLGFEREGNRFIQWLMNKCRRGIDEHQIMFGVEGERHLQERELSHLDGYMSSRPVRVGNGAYSQFQLDIYGEILDAIYFLHRHGEGVPRKEYNVFVRDLAEHICNSYGRPDCGIWEFRDSRKHFVYSKLWCWVGLDRAAQLALELDNHEDADRWRRVGKQIKTEILTKGWSETKKCFRQHYATDEPDAANLLMPLLKFIKPDHAKFEANVDATIRELSRSGFVYRYKTPDGLQGREGTFTSCTLWLVNCLTRLGRLDQALIMFENVLRKANHVGLYSEEIDIDTGRALGNFPQAFTHLNLINSALDLDAALNRQARSS
jgi:GH15 family glucan-1,4-alpha-glucosidase